MSTNQQLAVRGTAARHAPPRRAVRDGHEQQADAAASAFVRGVKGVASLLTPAPAASYAAPLSRGEPLPASLRAGLEEGFGADLAAVRIHRDAAAAAAARQQHAVAFAAGADLFFAAGRFEPGTLSGLELLAHEIAHALQQAGLADARRLRVVGGIGGQGEIQRKDPDVTLEDRFKQLELAQPPAADRVTATVVSVAERHRDADDADDDSRSHATAVAALAGSAADGPTLADALAARAQDPQFPRTSAPTVRLYFDCFKVLGRFDAALKMVGGKAEDIPEQTAFLLAPFYVAKMRGQGPDVAETLLANAVAARYWKQRVLDSFRISFYGLLRAPQDLDPNGKFRKILGAEFAARAAAENLTSNEWTPFALLAFLDFDRVRQAVLAEATGAGTGSSQLVDLANRKRAAIRQFAAGGLLKAKAEAVGFSPEVVDLCDEIDDDVAPLAEEATQFWERVLALLLGLVPTLAPDAQEVDEETLLARRQEFIRTVTTIPALKGLEGRLKTVAQTALGLGPGGKLPSEAQLRADLRLAHQQLASAVFRYDQGLIQLMRDLAALGEQPADKQAAAAEKVETWRKQADAYGVVLLLVLQIDATLKGLDRELPPAEAATGKPDPAVTQGRADHLLRYFRKVAQNFATLAALLGYKDLQLYAERVQLAQGPGLKKSYVALLGSFAPLATTLDDFKESFPTKLHGLEPLTGAEVSMLVFDLYYQALSDQLEQILDTKMPDGRKRRDVFDPKLGSIVNEAVQKLTAFKSPHRFRMPPEDVELFVRPADAENVGPLITAHEVYRAFVKTIDPDELIVVPDLVNAHLDGVIIWTVPNFKEIITILADVPGLTAAKLKDGSTLGEPTDANWVQWLRKLKDIKGGAGQFQQAILDAVKQSMELSWRILGDDLRAASINYRRSQGPLLFQRWRAYDPTKLVQFGVPNRIIADTLALGASLQPATEQNQHVTALLLELAPAMHEQLAPQPGLLSSPGTQRFDLILALLPHLLGATDLLKDAAQVRQVKALRLDFPDSEFANRVTKLQELLTHFQGVQTATQQQTQLGGDASTQALFVPGRGYPVVAGAEDGSDRFTIEGVKYELLQVHAKFTYMPALVVPPSAIEWPASALGRSELYDAAGNPVNTDRATMKLFDLKRNGKTITVTGADDRLLSEVTYAVQMQVIVRQLEDLAVVIEAFGEAITTALQIAFPEAAPAIAWAEIAGTALRFMTSREFEDLQAALEGDTSELLSKLWETVKSRFSVSLLWDYLLFDRDLLGPLKILQPLAGLLKRQKEVEGKGKHEESRSAVGRVFSRLRTVGEGVGRSFVGLHDRVNVPVRHVQLFVLDHPVVALVLGVIARNLYRLEALRLNNLAEDVRDLAKETVLGRVSDFLGKVAEVLSHLQEMELPEEIVPLDLVIEMVANFIIDRLPIKYRYPLRIFRAGLQQAQVWQKFFKFIADELRHHNLDPNLLWQRTIRAELEPHFEKAVQAVAGEVNTLLTRVPFLKDVVQVVAPGVKLQFGAGDFPQAGGEEAQPRPAAGAAAARPVHWNLRAVGGGVPLDSATLGAAGRRLGHDFGHVRLHTGAAAQPVTAAFRAEGLTSGSHVYLRPGLTPSSPSGRQTLYHELGHVLQQTGPRPLGGRHSQADLWGKPRAGLNWDPSLEAEAERVAEAAHDTGPAPGPARATPAREGPQPSLTDVVARFFKELGDPRVVREHAEKVERTGKSDQRGWPPAAKALAEEKQAKSVGDTLIAMLKGTAPVKATYDAPFNVGMTPGLIAEHLAEKKTIDFADVIGRLVRKSLTPVKKAAGKDEPEPKDAPKFRFDPGQFVFELQDYLLGKTGVLLRITPNLDKAEGSDDKVLKLDDPFAAVVVSYLHLPLVGPVSRLWRTVIANTFADVTDTQELRKRQSKAWLVLLGQSPSPGVYAKKKVQGKDELVLAKSVADQVVAALAPKTALTADALPPWADYIKTVRVEPIDPKFGQTGLRLGTYSQRVAPSGLQYGQDRDSHHTVQFLLIEYLNNQKDQKPFPYPLALYPGVSGKGRSVDSIGVVSEAGAVTGVALGEKNPFSGQINDRGPAMPTILLSRHTHRGGDVHITPKPDDLPDKPASQGSAVHGHFRAALGNYADIVLGPTSAKLKAIKDGEGGGPAAGKGGQQLPTPVELSQAIYSAACATYREIRDTMEAKLNNALDTHEVEYYESVVKTDTSGKKYNQDEARILDPAYKVDAARLSAVKSETASRTKQVMHEQFGFPEG